MENQPNILLVFFFHGRLHQFNFVIMNIKNFRNPHSALPKQPVIWGLDCCRVTINKRYEQFMIYFRKFVNCKSFNERFTRSFMWWQHMIYRRFSFLLKVESTWIQWCSYCCTLPVITKILLLGRCVKFNPHLYNWKLIIWDWWNLYFGLLL